MRLSTAEIFPAIAPAEAVTLEQLIEARGGQVLPLEVARELGAAVAARVAALHSTGRVLGNFDASCVRCTGEGRVSLARDGGRRLAPELHQELLPTQRSDVYAVAHIVYQLLTARTPMAAAASEDPTLLRGVPPPSRFNPAIDAELDAVVLAALQREPLERSASVVALQAALAATTSAAETIRQLVSELLPPAAPQPRKIPSFRTLVSAAAAEPGRTLAFGLPPASAAPEAPALPPARTTVLFGRPELASPPPANDAPAPAAPATKLYGVPALPPSPPESEPRTVPLPAAGPVTLLFGAAALPPSAPATEPVTAPLPAAAPATLLFGAAALPPSAPAAEPVTAPLPPAAEPATAPLPAAAPATLLFGAPATPETSPEASPAGPTSAPLAQPTAEAQQPTARPGPTTRRLDLLFTKWLASPPVADEPVLRERLWSSPPAIALAVFALVLLLGAALLFAARTPSASAAPPAPVAAQPSPVTPPPTPTALPAAVQPAPDQPAPVQPALQPAAPSPRVVQPAPARTPLREVIKKRRRAR